jgi:hypothetical protein
MILILFLLCLFSEFQAAWPRQMCTCAMCVNASRVCVRKCVCVCVCVCVCIYIYIYTHTHKHDVNVVGQMWLQHVYCDRDMSCTLMICLLCTYCVRNMIECDCNMFTVTVARLLQLWHGYYELGFCWLTVTVTWPRVTVTWSHVTVTWSHVTVTWSHVTVTWFLQSWHAYYAPGFCWLTCDRDMIYVIMTRLLRVCYELTSYVFYGLDGDMVSVTVAWVYWHGGWVKNDWLKAKHANHICYKWQLTLKLVLFLYFIPSTFSSHRFYCFQ